MSKDKSNTVNINLGTKDKSTKKKPKSLASVMADELNKKYGR